MVIRSLFHSLPLGIKRSFTVLTDDTRRMLEGATTLTLLIYLAGLD